jgi:sulfoxide reductase heme-binding subunit YedZ
MLQSRRFFWLVLTLPAVAQTFRYWQGSVFYGEYLHWTGELAAQLLIVTLAVTPLRLAFPEARWVRWLMVRRRYLGIATFQYSFLHAVAYLGREASLQPVVDDALTLAIGTGWIALAIFVLLAVTSNDASVRLLRRGWKRLHRTVYLAAALTFAHWILTAFDPLAGAAHLGMLALLQGFRLWKKHSLRRAAQRANPSGDTG